MARLPGPFSSSSAGLLTGIGDSFSVISSLTDIALPVPEILTMADLTEHRRFEIWKSEVWTYLRILSMVGQLETRNQHPIKRPLAKWEDLTQAYLIRRLLSVEVKILLHTAKTDIDMNDPLAIIDQLNREQVALQAEAEAKESKDWEQVDEI